MTTSDLAYTEQSVALLIRRWQPWLVCLTASLFFFYEFIQMQMFNSISPQLMRDFSLDATHLGLLSATYLYADVVFLLPAGLILDRVSTRSVILTAMAICIVGTIGFALAHSLLLAGFFHFLSGVGNGFCFLSCIMLASRWFPPYRQAFVMGLIVTVAMLGGVVAQTPLALLTDHVGWRQALVWDSVLGVLIMGLVWMNVSDYPEQDAARREEERAQSQAIPFWHSLFAALRTSQNWFCGLYTCLLNLPIMLINALWGGLYLTQIHHIPMAQAMSITTMIFFGTIVGSPTAGWISDRLGTRRMPMILGAITSLGCMLLIMFIPNLNFMSLMVLFFALGLFTATQVIGYPMVAESSPSTLTGASMGLAALLVMGGASVAQPLFGYLLDLNWSGLAINGVRQYTLSNFNIALSIIPIGFVVGLVVAFLARETNCKPYSES